MRSYSGDIFVVLVGLWLLAIVVVVMLAPLVVVITRRDPPLWGVVVTGVGLAVPVSWFTDGDWDAGVAVCVLLLGTWSIGAAALWAAVAAVTRGPPSADPDDPPAPDGFASASALLGVVFLCIVGASLVHGVTVRSVEPWLPGTAWLAMLPLSVLAVRSGQRADRVRRHAAALAVAGGLLCAGAWLEEVASDPTVRLVAVGFVVHGVLAGSGTARARRALAVAVGVGGLGGLVSQVAYQIAEHRLWLAARSVDAAEVPVADPDVPLLPAYRRATLGEPLPGAPWRAPRDQPVTVLAPHEPLPEDHGADWLSWLGLTPAGDVRVAHVVAGRSRIGLYHNAGTIWLVGLRRMPSPGAPRYGLPGSDVALTMREVRSALDAAPCPNLGVSLYRDEDWTAQEVFDLCAERQCSIEASHHAPCWDAYVSSGTSRP